MPNDLEYFAVIHCESCMESSAEQRASCPSCISLVSLQKDRERKIVEPLNSEFYLNNYCPNCEDSTVAQRMECSECVAIVEDILETLAEINRAHKQWHLDHPRGCNG